MPSRSRPPFPPPQTRNPVMLADGSRHTGTVFLKPVITHPRFDVGDYTYASSFDPPRDWAARLAPHLYAFSPEHLIIGRFCQIAHAATFITSSANHRFDGISSFPFFIFGGGPPQGRASVPAPGPDTVIGHDVWIGQGATVLPGARIGNGVIVGAGAVVGGSVPSYAIVAGNRAEIVRMRFDDATIARLNAVAWWHWPIETIVAHEAQICGGDVAALEAVRPGSRGRGA
ncbi:MAG: CatB-related O-acetyltransferase [Pseudomonadota bacterium]